MSSGVSGRKMDHCFGDKHVLVDQQEISEDCDSKSNIMSTIDVAAVIWFIGWL